MQALQYVAGSQKAVDAYVTPEEMVGKLKSWSERTSTSSMTQVHLGHGKAYYAMTSLDEDSPEYHQFEKNRPAIIHGHVVIINYCVHFGYSLLRWQTIVNALLGKDPGQSTPKIHRIRYIHIYEWDFNFYLSVKWRALIHHAMDNNLFNSACYGSVSGKSSLDPVFIREMEYEIVRMTRFPLVHFDNDATSCYDRFPCFLVNLASHKNGQAAQACVFQGRSLQQARYHLKTRYGISEEYISHTFDCPWFGSGQGAGNSPAYCLVLTSTLYDVYASKAQRPAQYHSPDGNFTASILQLGFVDDVNNRTNLPWKRPEDPQAHLCALLEQASQDNQLWHDIIEAANQQLELPKCMYHVMHFDFKPSGEPQMVVEAQPPQPLLVTSSTGQPAPITHVPSDKALPYLGCHKSLMNQVKQKRVLQAVELT